MPDAGLIIPKQPVQARYQTRGEDQPSARRQWCDHHRNDVSPRGGPHYDWHNEHMRSGSIPGFLRGSRYVALSRV
jgi:hypothetical protein